MLAAVKQNGYTLEYAGPARGPEDRAGRRGQDWQALEHADQGSKDQIVLAAVMKDGYALEYADRVKKDREIVMEAVKKDGENSGCRLGAEERQRGGACRQAERVGALEWASDVLKADKEVVRAAVEQNGQALVYADPKLKRTGIS